MDSSTFEVHESMTALESALTRAHEQLPESAQAPERKEAIRDVVKMHAPASTATVTPPANDATLPTVSPEERVTLERELNVAFREGLDKAVAHIEASGAPHMIDAFHDLLTDHFYDKLVSSGQLDPNA